MKLAFLLYKYFPYGGMQRDFRRFVEEIQQRGHDCRVYYISWQGEPLAGADLRAQILRRTNAGNDAAIEIADGAVILREAGEERRLDLPVPRDGLLE